MSIKENDLRFRKLLFEDLKFHLGRLKTTHLRMLSELRFRDSLPNDIFHDEFQLLYHREVMMCFRDLQYDLHYLLDLLDELKPLI